jgi:hypothetical protein
VKFHWETAAWHARTQGVGFAKRNRSPGRIPTSPPRSVGCRFVESRSLRWVAVRGEDVLKYGFDCSIPPRAAARGDRPSRAREQMTIHAQSAGLLRRGPTGWRSASPALVPGIDFTDDPLMQAQLFLSRHPALHLGEPQFRRAAESTARWPRCVMTGDCPGRGCYQRGELPSQLDRQRRLSPEPAAGITNIHPHAERIRWQQLRARRRPSLCASSRNASS